ncbi:MAG TPA: GNAT family N-acetyltransferase [Bryobacteraceae bacterium]|jgi:phosphinothricin acetyltransferase|nr:GNAT family N-acetyltransferase [Bryobacteraceae bacterium]
MDWAIAAMQDADWLAVREIYGEGIATGNATFQTEAPQWPEWDADHLRHSRLIAQGGGTAGGWAALSAVSRRACYAGVAEVSIYIAAAHRGQGLGRRLLAALIDRSEAHGIWTLQAGIFPENAASLALHERLGFRQVGVRERIAQRDGIWRDTVLLERRSKVVGI